MQNIEKACIYKIPTNSDQKSKTSVLIKTDWDLLKTAIHIFIEGSSMKYQQNSINVITAPESHCFIFFIKRKRSEANNFPSSFIKTQQYFYLKLYK